MYRKVGSILLCAFILSAIFVIEVNNDVEAQLTEEWIARYNSPGNGFEHASDIVVDSSGNVYVTGSTEYNTSDNDYVTVKYNANGIEQWVARYNGPGNSYDSALEIRVDSLGNVYVTGWSEGNGTDWDYGTIKYDSSGNELWVARYNGPGNGEDGATDMVLDSFGNIYVTGFSEGVGTDNDFATIAYDSFGNELWVARYNGPQNDSDVSGHIDIDVFGNIYVTGFSMDNTTFLDYLTIKYDNNGNQLWVARYNGIANHEDRAYDIIVDSSGNIYITGASEGNGTGFDLTTIKYDSNGNELWVARYNGPGNGDDDGRAMIVDQFGNIYVTGYSEGNGTDYDYTTIKYDSNGNELWVARYNGPGNGLDHAYDIALDPFGHVFITGLSWGGWLHENGTLSDYTTIAYDSYGNELWVAIYNGPGESDWAHDLTTDALGYVYVTGTSLGNGTWYDYATIKYSCHFPNQQPIADAGPDQTVNEGNVVLLNGSGSVGGELIGITPPSNLVSWWPGDGNANDIADGNHGTLIGGTTFDVGKVEQAFDFDGINDRIGVPDSDNLKITASLTIDAWIYIKTYPSPSQGHAQIIFRGDDRTGLDPYYLSVQPNGTMRFHVESLSNRVDLETPIPKDQFVFVAATLDDATGLMRIYINDTVAAETTTNIRPFRDLDPLYDPGIGIGNHAPSSTRNQPFHGLIDEMEVFNRCLNASDLQAIFNSGIAGKYKGRSVKTQIVSYEWDFESDGVYDYVETINNSPDGAFDGKTTHIWGDNGMYIVTLRITDEIGAKDTDICNVMVNNLLPTIYPFGPFTIESGFPLTINTNATDPGSDDLIFTWSWGDWTSDTMTVYYNDGIGSDPHPSPWGTYPFSANETIQHTYKNYGIYKLNLKVEDDDGGVALYNTNVTVIGLPPPTLNINTSPDGKDSILYWDPPPAQGIDHYLIYRSTSQRDFDFNNAWKNTSIDKEPGEPKSIPLRTMWNDTNAAFPGNVTNYEEQYYYVIRAVNIFGNKSITSRTVGKWTKSYSQGISTFSLPLQPLQNLTIDYCLNDMNAKYIKWMDPVLHKWMKHGERAINDSLMKLGEGYEVKFDIQTNYTFTGMPGAMIMYDDNSFGFDATPGSGSADGLSAIVDSAGNITLSWITPMSLNPDVSFQILRSTKRDGFWGSIDMDYEHIGTINICSPGSIVTILDKGIAKAGKEFYYMIIPTNSSSGERGVSTYSIGIWSEEYHSGYDTFGIPLKLINNHTADWYCDNIPDTVGINYFNFNEQRWCWHSSRMPAGAYDPLLIMTEGYQISTSNTTKFTFIGV